MSYRIITIKLNNDKEKVKSLLEIRTAVTQEIPIQGGEEVANLGNL